MELPPKVNASIDIAVLSSSTAATAHVRNMTNISGDSILGFNPLTDVHMWTNVSSDAILGYSDVSSDAIFGYNDVSSDDILGYSDTNYSVIVRICLLGGLVVISIIGNTLAAHKLLKKKWTRTRTTVLFLHLTLADILVTIFPMAGQMIWETLDLVWYANSEFCKLFKFLQTFSLVSSNYMLVAIAIDRHQAITRPLATPISPYW